MENLATEEKNSSPSAPSHRSTNQNLVALAILLGGLFLGSLLVDFVQLATGSGFSVRVVRKQDVLSAGGKTWVAYQEPKVRLQMVTDTACSACEGKEALTWLRRIVPTVAVEKIDIRTPLGQKLLSHFDLKTLPAFIFSPEITKTEFYAQAPELFQERDMFHVFDMMQIGLPAGKYLEPPMLTEEDIVLGSREAPVKMIIYTDFECQYCKEFHGTVTEVRKEFEEQVAVAFRHLPLSFHPRASEAAIAAECAAEQGKFEDFANRLFEKQSEWGEQLGRNWFTAEARSLNLDSRRFQGCLANPATAQKIAADGESADHYGITGTPSTFINGVLLSGAVEYDILKKTVQEQLETR